MDTFPDDSDHSTLLGLIAVDLFVPATRSEPARREQQAWTFDLSIPRSRDEFDAAAASIADDIGGYKKSFVSEDGTLCHAIACRQRSDGDINAEHELRTATIAFAALSAWGSGPLDGFSETLLAEAALAPMTREKIGAWACRAALQYQALDFEAHPAPAKRPGL